MQYVRAHVTLLKAQQQQQHLRHITVIYNYFDFSRMTHNKVDNSYLFDVQSTARNEDKKKIRADVIDEEYCVGFEENLWQNTYVLFSYS